jgi:polygalacturonase
MRPRGAKGEKLVIKNALRRAAASRKVWLAALAVVGLSTATAGVAMAGTSTGDVAPAGVSANATAFSLKSFGAKADGKTNDAPALDKAISAASNAGGGVVNVPAGVTVLAAGTVHLQSNVTINVPSGSTITGSASGYDKPESNPNDKFQDYGHSHFHNAMFFGDRVNNVTFTGGGTIDGGGHLITGNPKSGQADKIISITRCNGLNISNITLKRGGHFAALINGCTNVTSDHLTIRTAGDRDGWNIISTTNVTITNADIAANDDALPFKSDYALGAKLPNGHVTVTNSKLSAGCCNALMFGSETCGDFTDYDFNHITITGAGKSGLGMVSMDGAKISNVRYSDITLSGTASPIMLKVGTRKRCGNSPGVGDISDIHFTNITGTNAGAFSPTIWGQPGHQVSNVTFNNVKLNVPGGHAAMGTGVPSDSGDYNPKSLGTRPAYGWYLHNISGITFTNSGVSFSKNDQRPAVIANTGSNVKFDTFTYESGSGAPFDFGFQGITGYCVTNSGSPKISATGSTASC